MSTPTNEDDTAAAAVRHVAYAEGYADGKQLKSGELRALLKEVLDVLHCHHRNTHKPLIERVRTYRSKL